MLPDRDPISSHPPLDPPAGEPTPASPVPMLLVPTAPVIPLEEEEFAEPWDPAKDLNFFQRWTRGWRLVVVLLTLAAGYGKWRGGKDYSSFKRWRAQGIAADALTAAASGSTDQAIALFDKAAILAPFDPVVMRRMADFCEPRQDIMAIYALRQVAMSGEAEPADYERLCRLALDWGRPELASSQTMKDWAAAAADTLTPTQLRLSANWLASRGQYQEGGDRLRQALAKTSGTDQSPVMEVALARLLMNAASSAGMAESAAAEPLKLLSGVAYSPSAPLALRTEATRLLAGLLLHPARRPLLTPLRADLLRTAFTDLATETAPDDAAGAINFELAAVTVDLAALPERRGSLVQGVLEKAATAPATHQLLMVKWLNENQFYAEALELCRKNSSQTGDPAWFTAKMDALFAMKSFDEAASLLSATTQPLPAHLQQLFLYRIDLARGLDEAALEPSRSALEKAASRAQPNDILSTAENLERSGDTATALTLFTSLKGHPQAGLSARLGMVRCLDAMPNRSSDLLKALEGVLQLWPQSDQARNDLAYVRLLDGQPTEDDLSAVADLDRQSPWYLSFRISAALAALHQKKPAEALALLERDNVPWDRVRPGWQAVYAAVLTANGRNEDANAIAFRLKNIPLRPGEQKLLGKLP